MACYFLEFITMLLGSFLCKKTKKVAEKTKHYIPPASPLQTHKEFHEIQNQHVLVDTKLVNNQRCYLKQRNSSAKCFDYFCLENYWFHTISDQRLFPNVVVQIDNVPFCTAAFWEDGSFHLCYNTVDCRNRFSLSHLCTYHANMQRENCRYYHKMEEAKTISPASFDRNLVYNIKCLVNLSLRWLHAILFFEGKMNHGHAGFAGKYLQNYNDILFDIFRPYVWTYQQQNLSNLRNYSEEDLLTDMMDVFSLFGYHFLKNSQIFVSDVQIKHGNRVLSSDLFMKPLYLFLADSGFLPPWNHVQNLQNLRTSEKGAVY